MPRTEPTPQTRAVTTLRDAAICASLMALCQTAFSQADVPRVWRVCVGDQPVPPYVLNDPKHLGRAERLLVEAGRSIGMNVMLQRYPNKRCRASLSSGDSDMTLGGPTPENLAEWRFPMKAGIPDPDQAVAHINLIWVRRSDSQLDWDGKQLTGAPAGKALVVGTRAGQLLATNALRHLSVQVDDTAHTPKQLLRKLVGNRVDLVLGLQEELEVALADPEVQSSVVLPRALRRNDYFAVISQLHLSANFATAERLWAAMGRMRNLPEFQRD